MLLAAAGAVLANQIDTAVTTFSNLGRLSFNAAGSANLSNQLMLNTFGTVFVEGAKTLLPLFGTLFVLALLVPFLQVGPLLSGGPLTPKFSKLNPIAGLKRSLFSLRAYVELLKSAVKITVVAVIFWKPSRPPPTISSSGRASVRTTAIGSGRHIPGRASSRM
jgi:flagellar biosynthetic protein FlhB